MNRTLLSSTLGITLLLSSCSKTNKSDPTIKNAAIIADMECQSRTFTHQKFLLAARYSQLDNKMIKHQLAPPAADSIRHILDTEKQGLLNSSQGVSDSLRHFLRKLWKEEYTSKGQRDHLDSLTEIQLKKTCPLSTP
jgi:hypothetical protein